MRGGFLIDFIETSSWNPPPVGSPEREKWPRLAFLDPDNRLYPVMQEVGGEWVYSADALRSAIWVANRNGDVAISRKASILLSKYHDQNEVNENLNANEQSALRYEISSKIYKNAIGENDALRGYSKLLEDMVKWRAECGNTSVCAIISEAITQIREICSDEKNHKIILYSIANKLDQIEITPDGMSAALENIVSMVGESS